MEKEEAEGKFFHGWRVEVGGRRSEVGGWRSEADEKERKNFFLETPPPSGTGSFGDAMVETRSYQTRKAIQFF